VKDGIYTVFTLVPGLELYQTLAVLEMWQASRISRLFYIVFKMNVSLVGQRSKLCRGGRTIPRDEIWQKKPGPFSQRTKSHYIHGHTFACWGTGM